MITINGVECELLGHIGDCPLMVRRVSDGLVAYAGLGSMHWGREVSGVVQHGDSLLYIVTFASGKRRVVSYNPQTRTQKILIHVMGNELATATVELV